MILLKIFDVCDQNVDVVCIFSRVSLLLHFQVVQAVRLGGQAPDQLSTTCSESHGGSGSLLASSAKARPPQCQSRAEWHDSSEDDADVQGRIVCQLSPRERSYRWGSSVNTLEAKLAKQVTDT